MAAMKLQIEKFENERKYAQEAMRSNKGGKRRKKLETSRKQTSGGSVSKICMQIPTREMSDGASILRHFKFSCY